MDNEMRDVVAALVWDGDRFMICQRPAHKARGLLWEFVGGKVEPGETKEEALIRECHEELDVTVEVGSVFMEVIHEYPDIKIKLTLFNAKIAEGEPKMLEHNDIRWITTDEIPQYAFCPADTDILSRLIAENAGTEHAEDAK
jgi:8-oxo-dGTP diphosphatase